MRSCMEQDKSIDLFDRIKLHCSPVISRWRKLLLYISETSVLFKVINEIPSIHMYGTQCAHGFVRLNTNHNCALGPRYKPSKSTREAWEVPLSLILREGETASYTSSRQWVGNVIDDECRRGPNLSRDKDSPSTKCQRSFRRTDDWVEATSCLQDGKRSLKADKPPVGQRHKDVKRNWEY